MKTAWISVLTDCVLISDAVKNPRRFIGPLVGLLLSLLFLALALYNVKLDDVAAAIQSANYGLVLLSGVLTLTSYLLRTLRWRLLLRHRKQIPVRRLFPVLVVGFALNNLLPGRPGEFARAISLGQREGMSKTLGLATIIVERVADGLTLIALLAVISLGFTLPGWGQQAEILSLVIFAVALGGLIFLLGRESFATAILERVLHFLPARISVRLREMFGSFILGLHSLRSPGDVLGIGVLSLGVWLCEAAHYWVVFTAFGLFADLPTRALAAAFTMVTVNLSIAIPAAPGGVGPFEWAGSLALAAFQVPASAALSAVLIAHTVQYSVVTVAGLIFTAREGVRMTRAIEPEKEKPGF